MTTETRRTLAAMRAASQKGYNPYDSHSAFARMYTCLWRFAR